MDKNRTAPVMQEEHVRASGSATKPPLRAANYGLKSDVLNSTDVLAQSVSCLAPTATPALLIPLVFASAGNGCWLAYVIATVGLVLVARNINQFASRSASPGSIYSYVAIGLGPGMGMLTGWLLLCAYLIVIACLEAEFAFYAKPAFEQIFSLKIDPLWAMVGSTSLAAFIAWRDIKISSSVMFVLEFCSISLMLILVAITFLHFGTILDWNQITLVGASPQGVTMGLVFAIFGYTGFESAASLGSEAKDPLINIPKAIMRSTLWSGVFYVISSYAMIMAYRGSSVSLDKCATPLTTLATLDGVMPLGLILSCGAMVSFFACILACINTASRLLFLMGHHGLFHQSVSEAHADNHTPHIAIAVATIIGAAPAIILLLAHVSLIDIISWTGTVTAYAFISSYALVSLAAPFYLHHLRCLKPMDIVVSVLAVIAMGLALVGNVVLGSGEVVKYLPLVFAALLVIGLVWYAILKVFSPETIRLMSQDMIKIRDQFATEPS